VTALRIAVVKPDWGIRGGFEIVLDRIVAHLRAGGHRVDLLGFDAGYFDGRPFGKETPPDVVSRAPQFFAYVAQLERCRQLDVRRADVVISTQPPSFAVEHERHLSIFFHHNRIFYDLSGPAVAAGLVPAEHHAAATEAVRAIDDDALSRVSHVLAGSQTVQRRLADFNGRRHGVGVFHAGPNIEQHEDARVVARERRIALCLSRHEFPKRTELFVHAMHLAPNIPGVAVGSGGRLGYVRQFDADLARHGVPATLGDAETWLNTTEWIDPQSVPSSGSNVDFRTNVDDEQLGELLRSAFCFVAPALEEDYGLTAIEAMRHGVPVITCSDSGHLKHFVDDGVTGLIVSPSGPAISAAMRYLAENPERAAEMGECGREVASRYTWQRALREFDLGLEAALA
jgi:glycosyltransferase involved in cell wall biosynthesis